MKITINISKKDLKHLENCDGKYSACGTIERIITKIEKVKIK